jgi:hypothetical protein
MLHVLLIALATASLAAADATGKWTGNLVIADGDGQPRPAYLVLKQEGNTLTGTAGPDAGEQHPIQNGKADNGTLTFELATGEAIMRFALKQDGDVISGDITRERGGETQKARLSVKRAE